MPPEFKSMIYGATLWGLKHPIEEQDIASTFARARQIFNESGFKGKTCSVELFSASEPVDLKYAQAVNEASTKNNLIPVTTILRQNLVLVWFLHIKRIEKMLLPNVLEA